MPEEYTVGFTIIPGKDTYNGWSNIIHFTATGENCCDPGDRVPGVWFFKNSYKLHVINGVHENNECPVPEPLKPNVESVFKMVHRGNRVDVFVNGELVCTEPSPTRVGFEKVSVYASMGKPANAVLKDFYFSRGVPREPEYNYLIRDEEPRPLVKGTLLGVVTVPYEYEVGFELTPTDETVDTWSNIIHFSATGNNCCNAGDRIPGVWFYANTRKLHVINGPHRNDLCPIADDLEAFKTSTIRI